MLQFGLLALLVSAAAGSAVRPIEPDIASHWSVGDYVAVTWIPLRAGPVYIILTRRDQSDTTYPVASLIDDAGYFTWHVPAIVASDCASVAVSVGILQPAELQQYFAKGRSVRHGIWSPWFSLGSSGSAVPSSALVNYIPRFMHCLPTLKYHSETRPNEVSITDCRLGIN